MYSLLHNHGSSVLHSIATKLVSHAGFGTYKKITKITERDPMCPTYIPIYYFENLYTPPSSHTRLMSRTSRIKMFCWASANVKTSIGLKLIPWLSQVLPYLEKDIILLLELLI